MIATIVHVWVKEPFIEQFIEESTKNHEGAIKEPGNLKFDLIQDAEDPCKFVFYEVYKTEEDIAAHKKTKHYLDWRETVQDWMAQPRQGVKHYVVKPTNPSLW